MKTGISNATQAISQMPNIAMMTSQGSSVCNRRRRRAAAAMALYRACARADIGAI